jgi:hypothetical protein
MPKKIPPHIKEKAIRLRLEKNLTVPEIVEMLKVSQGTVHSWMLDYPLQARNKERSPAQKESDQLNRDRAAKKRQDAYDEGWQQAPELFKDPEFRDFINIYLAEGYKKSRNQVSIANSDADIIIMAHHYMKLFANPDNIMEYSVQTHIDQDEDDIKRYWGKLLGLEPQTIKTLRKSNSGELSGRNWRSEYGVLTIRIGDTYFRSKMQAWIDYLKKQWLDRFKKN